VTDKNNGSVFKHRWLTWDRFME